MRILKYYVTLLTIPLLLVTCTSSDENLISPATDEIEVYASIVSTRVNLDNEGKGNFVSGDQIRLLTTANTSDGIISRELTLTDNQWLPPLRWSELNASKAVISAFYPANSTLGQSDTFIHQVASNQVGDEDFQRSDLLYATDEIMKNEEAAYLTFSHLMSRLVVKLNSDGSFSEEELAQAQISLKAIQQITVNCMTGKLTLPTEREETITMHHAQENIYMAIVCPQPVAERWRSEEWLKIRIGNKIFTYKAPDRLSDQSEFKELQQGQQIVLNITLKQKAEDTDWRDKTVWVYGIHNPPVNEWGYSSTFPYEEKGLKWDISYGWYDCNKRFPNGGLGNNDSNLCWAAASSNLLYWWLEQNKEYIDRFGKYTGPKEYKNSLDCEIFEFYKKNFHNTGNEVAAALSWFLTGRYGMVEKDGAGFFREVFGSVHVARITRFSERSFPEELKKAFTEKEAIECTIRYPNNQLIHAITLWGADFDSNGDVKAIYITENNDRDIAEQTEFVDYKGRKITQAGIVQKRVQKKSDGFYYIESSNPGKYTFRIEELNILGLMEEEWEAYFAK